MSHMDSWGFSSPQSKTADKVDHIADKISFAIDMTGNSLIAIDDVVKELIAKAGATTPPRPEDLKAMAGRLQTYQKQVNDNLLNIKNLAKDIDRATDNIQNSNGGWGV